MTNMPEPALFKILNQNMQSCNGGKFVWKLHKWQKVRGRLKICERGLHLTVAPEQWHHSQTDRIFVAEAKEIAEWQLDKCVCRSVRLLAEVPQTLWDAYHKQIQPLRDACDKQIQPLRDEIAQKTLAEAK